MDQIVEMYHQQQGHGQMVEDEEGMRIIEDDMEHIEQQNFVVRSCFIYQFVDQFINEKDRIPKIVEYEIIHQKYGMICEVEIMGK